MYPHITRPARPHLHGRSAGSGASAKNTYMLHTIVGYAIAHPDSQCAWFARTPTSAQEVFCGILAHFQTVASYRHAIRRVEQERLEMVLRNGSVIVVVSAQTATTLRGRSLAYAQA